MKRLIKFALACGMMTSMSVSASVIPYSKTYYCNYHFGPDFWGQKVENVMVHAGVQKIHDPISSARGATVWQDVKDVFLKEVDGKFTGKTFFNATGYGGSLNAELDPIFQFWVTLENGETRILEPELAKEVREFRIDYESEKEAADQAIANWKAESAEDIDSVYCFSTFDI